MLPVAQDLCGECTSVDADWPLNIFKLNHIRWHKYAFPTLWSTAKLFWWRLSKATPTASLVEHPGQDIPGANTYPSEVPGSGRGKHGKVVSPLPFRPRRGEKQATCSLLIGRTCRASHRPQMQLYQKQRCLEKWPRLRRQLEFCTALQIFSGQIHARRPPSPHRRPVSESLKSVHLSPLRGEIKSKIQPGCDQKARLNSQSWSLFLTHRHHRWCEYAFPKWSHTAALKRHSPPWMPSGVYSFSSAWNSPLVHTHWGVPATPYWHIWALDF